MPRPAVDVVVPFVGPRESLERLRADLARLRLGAGDTVLVVDNTPGGEGTSAGPVRVIAAGERRTPGYARNRGVALGAAPWIVFLDADTEPSEDLLDRYFEPSPAERTAVLGGGIRDEPVAHDGPPAARYAYIREAMSQEDTLRFGEWGFPKTANCAVRRTAFEAVGGFREDIRTAEDADLNFRLREAGWGVERRDQALVIHRSRRTIGAFVVQRALYGAGGAWLERQYPGSFPARRRPGLVWWAARTALGGLYRAARLQDRDGALRAVFEPLEALTWELGRSLPNDRPLTRDAWWRALRGLRGVAGAPRI